MTTEAKKWYRPGLRFTSPISAYQVICRPHRKKRTSEGDVYDETRELLAEFALHGGEYQYENVNGFTDMAADIRGHFFDLDTQAEQKGWDDAEKEIVARKLLRETIEKFPGRCQLYSAPTVEKPWPKYDDTHHNQIPVLAEQLGLVGEALAYESQNKARESVIAKLNELASAPREDTVEDDLIAA